MELNHSWNRRSFISALSVAAGSLWNAARAHAWPRPPADKDVSITGFGQTGEVYAELGVTPVINGQGTMTVLGGSLMRPEVSAVMALAARHFIAIADLEVAAGKRIAEMLKLPKGYTGLVTSGAAAAIQSGYAGVLTGDNPEFIQRLPDLTGMKSEVIIQKSHRNPFDHQIRATGAKLVEVETREDVRRAISPRTAMLHFSNFANDSGRIKVDEWVKLAKENNLPSFNDAAADVPPVSRLWEYVNMGYDLVTFSGGKAIRGPQSAGLLLGREDLVSYALLNNCPNEDTLGRSQKVGKEEIVGMVKALELFLAEDHDALLQEYWRRLDYISQEVTRIHGVSTAFHFNPKQIANHTVSMQIFWDPRHISIGAREVSDQLKSGKPSIVLGGGGRGSDGVGLSAWMLQPGEEKIIAERMVEILRAHSIA